MRAMVDTDGSVVVASQTGRGKVKSRSNYIKLWDNIISALQETKSFGSNVYSIAGAVVLTSGRNLPPLNVTGSAKRGLIAFLNFQL